MPLHFLPPWYKAETYSVRQLRMSALISLVTLLPGVCALAARLLRRFKGALVSTRFISLLIQGIAFDNLAPSEPGFPLSLDQIRRQSPELWLCSQRVLKYTGKMNLLDWRMLRGKEHRLVWQARPWFTPPCLTCTKCWSWRGWWRWDMLWGSKISPYAIRSHFPKLRLAHLWITK